MEHEAALLLLEQRAGVPAENLHEPRLVAVVGCPVGEPQLGDRIDGHRATLTLK